MLVGKNICTRVVLAVMLLGLGLQAMAQSAEQKELLKRINDIKASPALKEKAMKQGKARTALCKRCHGVDGNSLKPKFPNLAGQNAAYILEQMEKYADKRRKFRVMNVLSRKFTLEDKVNLSIYFGEQKVKPVLFNADLAAKGKVLYEKSCQKCHGKNGLGDGKDRDEDVLFARIAGQKEVYVSNTLKVFRGVANNQLTSTSKVYRESDKMEEVTKNLSDTDIVNLAAYVASLGR